jgi:hypothetical protein
MPKPKRRKGASPTPIDARQKDLVAQQEAVNAQMQQLKALIDKAPGLKKQALERQREELISRAAAGSRRIDTPTLLDKRYDAVVAMPGARPRRRALKSEQRQARLTFFGLLIALLVLSLWVWSIWH